jgi:four helix bundle protein
MRNADCGLIFELATFKTYGVMTPEEMKARTKKFAVAMLQLGDEFPKSIAGRVVANQLIRAATSVAANYRAACRARSRAEFASKIGNVEEEADESAFWIERSKEAGLVEEQRVCTLQPEADELTRIMVASGRTAQPRQKKR